MEDKNGVVSISMVDERAVNPVAPTIMPRYEAFFDAKNRRREKNTERKVFQFNYKDIVVEIKRPENTVVHEKLFYSILRLGKRQDIYVKDKDGNDVKYSNLFLVDFYELKKVAGLNKTLTAERVKELLEDLKDFQITFQKGDSKLVLTSLISRAFIAETTDKENGMKKHILAVEIDDDTLKLVEKVTRFTLPVEILENINKQIKSPFVYKIVMFFQTQSKNQKHELFSLISIITQKKKIPPKQKTLIKKSVVEYSDKLHQFGVTVKETDEGKIVLEYKRPKYIFFTFPKSN